MLTRRNFALGLSAMFAAPYVIRHSGVLMPVRNHALSIKSIATTFKISPMEIGKMDLYEGALFYRTRWPEVPPGATFGETWHFLHAIGSSRRVWSDAVLRSKNEVPKRFPSGACGVTLERLGQFRSERQSAGV